MAEHAEKINLSLKVHQVAAKDWHMNDVIQNLHLWAERFIFEFKLKTSNAPAIMIDYLGRTRLGHFRPGRNGFGLRNEIAINTSHINASIRTNEFWEVLGTLLHELLHVEQHESGNPGKSNYHNKEFKDRAEEFGLIVDSWGHMQYSPAPSAYFDLLKKHGVSVPQIKEPVQATKMVGNSKLKPWICRCIPPVHVRVAIKDFQAVCLKCDSMFRPK